MLGAAPTSARTQAFAASKAPLDRAGRLRSSLLRARPCSAVLCHPRAPAQHAPSTHPTRLAPVAPALHRSTGPSWRAPLPGRHGRFLISFLLHYFLSFPCLFPVLLLLFCTLLPLPPCITPAVTVPGSPSDALSPHTSTDGGHTRVHGVLPILLPVGSGGMLGVVTQRRIPRACADRIGIGLTVGMHNLTCRTCSLPWATGQC